jgi:hypothetical protein
VVVGGTVITPVPISVQSNIGNVVVVVVVGGGTVMIPVPSRLQNCGMNVCNNCKQSSNSAPNKLSPIIIGLI